MSVKPLNNSEREEIEIKLLLQALYEYYGYDFRQYSLKMIKRRIKERLDREKLQNIAQLIEKILYDRASMRRLVNDFTIQVSTMFRDPDIFKFLKENVIPVLKTFPFLRIWHAGCGYCEEVLSMCILLHEEGLYKKSLLYATDLNAEVIQKAKNGIFTSEMIKEFTQNYIQAGGKESFSEYYYARFGNAVFYKWLRKNIVFSQHCLVTDNSFNEFQVIFARNVMIYFDQHLQSKVHELFYKSLVINGFLILGKKESIRFTPFEKNYQSINAGLSVYKKIR